MPGEVAISTARALLGDPSAADRPMGRNPASASQTVRNRPNGSNGIHRATISMSGRPRRYKWRETHAFGGRIKLRGPGRAPARTFGIFQPNRAETRPRPPGRQARAAPVYSPRTINVLSSATLKSERNGPLWMPQAGRVGYQTIFIARSRDSASRAAVLALIGDQVVEPADQIPLVRHVDAAIGTDQPARAAGEATPAYLPLSPLANSCDRRRRSG